MSKPNEPICGPGAAAGATGETDTASASESVAATGLFTLRGVDPLVVQPASAVLQARNNIIERITFSPKSFRRVVRLTFSNLPTLRPFVA
ncbi:MAG: hypothetical protein M3Q52_05600, partial [Pseudomonadota bacterium]|nr:hypothetical protein [Pseudomonadota bacterium]